MGITRLIIGTRKSRLALWQSEYIRAEIQRVAPDCEVMLLPIDTQGDRSQVQDVPLPAIGGKGLFTAELESALEAGDIDIAVHSLKDLPTAPDSRFILGAIPKRAASSDVLVSRFGQPLNLLAVGACIGTSSLRRSAQLRRLRPDLSLRSIRGNVDTRIAKVLEDEHPYDATVLAHAGLERVGRADEISQIFSPQEMMPAPGQGALAVQIRADAANLRALLEPIHDLATAAAVYAERSFLHRLNAGCNTPVGALAVVRGSDLMLSGRCLSPDGEQCIDVHAIQGIESTNDLGRALADEALERGAHQIINQSCSGE